MDNNIPNKQTISLIARRAPYGSDGARQTLDIAFAAAVFEQPLNYIFIGDGVFQLVAGQNSVEISSKPQGAALETLELYGINEVFVHSESLLNRGLTESHLVCSANLIEDCALKQLIAESTYVINL